MSYKTRLKGACKTCIYATLRYDAQMQPKKIWCISRNGSVKNCPKKCDRYQLKKYIPYNDTDNSTLKEVLS